MFKIDVDRLPLLEKKEFPTIKQTVRKKVAPAKTTTQKPVIAAGNVSYVPIKAKKAPAVDTSAIMDKYKNIEVKKVDLPMMGAGSTIPSRLRTAEQKQADDLRQAKAMSNSALARFAYGVGEGLHIRGHQKATEVQKDIHALIDNTTAGKAGEIVGQVGQFAVPYSGAVGGMAQFPKVVSMGTRIGKGLAKVSPKIGQATAQRVGQGISRSVATDLAVGLPLNINIARNKEGLRGEEAAKNIALNTAIDLVAGGALEVIGGVLLKSGRKVATKSDFDALPASEKGEVLTEIERLAYESNVRKGKITPQGDTLYGNAPRPIAGELPAPSRATGTPIKAKKEPTAQTLDEFLGERGLSAPMSNYMLDKGRIPHGQTARQNAKMIKEANAAADAHQEARAAAIKEYRAKVATGEIRDKTAFEQRIATAHGHSDNKSVQAARRRLEKQGIDYKDYNPDGTPIKADIYSAAKGQKEVPRTVTPGEMSSPIDNFKMRLRGSAQGSDTSIQAQRAEVEGIAPQATSNTSKATGGNINTARSKINYGNKKKSTSLWQQARAQFVDDMAPLETLEKSVRGSVASAEKSLYKQARLYKGIPEKANLVIENELKPIIKSVEKSGKSYKDLGLYAEAVHARDVNRAGLKSGLTDSEIDDVIKQLGTPEMEAARKELVAYSNRRLEGLVDAGVISKEQFNAMRAKWSNYMPLNRAFDDESVEFGAGISKALTTGQSPIQALKGSDRKIIDPIESMIKNTYKTELAIGKNKVGRQLADLATEDSAGAFVRRLDEGETTGRKNVVHTIENGEKVSFEVTPEVYKALKGLNNEASNLLIKVFQTPASVLRAGAVLTPEFAMRNPMRDIQQAFINSGSGFNPITDFTAGLASYIKKGDLYQEYIKNSAGYGNIISMDRKKHKEVVQSMLTKTPTEKAINIVNPQSWLRVLRNISDATESATKMGEFRAAIRSGATPQEAAYRARDIMDFARAGSSVRQVNKVVAFLNANIQGKSKMIRSIQRDPLGVGTRLVASMAVPSVGAYALNHQLANERQRTQIKDAPAWLRDTFWLIAVPGTDTVARIPKPFEGAAVANVLERFLDYLEEKDPKAFDGFVKDTIRDQSIPVMLTGLTPIVEGMANYSFFRDSPLIPQREKYLERKDQHDIFTSEAAKVLAGGVEKVFGDKTNFSSPRVMDNTIKGLTAGLGTYATDAIDAMIGKNKPAKNPSQFPVIKAFAVNENSSGKSMDFLYEEADRLTRSKNSNPETFEQYAELKYLESVKNEVSELSKEIRAIQNDIYIKPVEKRDRLNKLMRERNDLVIKAVNENLPQVQEETERLSMRYSDPDELYREVNKSVFGTEYALRKYDKTLHEKAQKFQAAGSSYDNIYKAYFGTKDLESDKDRNGKTITNSLSRKKKAYIDKTFPNASRKEKQLLYEMVGVGKTVGMYTPRFS